MTAPNSQKKQRRVLLTGGAGFVGSHLTRALLRSGFNVTILDDFSTGRLENVPADPRIRIVEGSVTNSYAVANAARGSSFVYHAAGVVGMRLAATDQERAYRVAVEGTEKVLKATGDAPFVLFSSSAVYGLTDESYATESQPLNRALALQYDGGKRGYSTGKVDAEVLTRQTTTSRRSVLVVRPFNLIGIRQRGKYGMVVPSFLERARAGQTIQVYGDGTQSRCFSDIQTFVLVLRKLCQCPEAWVPTRNIFNIGSATETTILDLAHLALRVTEAKVEIEFIPYNSIFPGKHDVQARVPDLSRLTCVLGTIYWPTVARILKKIDGYSQRKAKSSSVVREMLRQSARELIGP